MGDHVVGTATLLLLLFVLLLTSATLLLLLGGGAFGGAADTERFTETSLRAGAAEEAAIEVVRVVAIEAVGEPGAVVGSSPVATPESAFGRVDDGH